MASAFESIATSTPSAGTSTVTFSSISSSFDHYYITMYYRANSGTNNSNVHIRLNNDSGSTSYTQIRNMNSGGSIGNGANADIAQFDIGDVTGEYTASEIWVIGTQTSNWKPMWAQGMDNASGARAKFNYGAYKSTSTIDRIDLFLGDSRAFGSNSVIALYGIKGS